MFKYSYILIFWILAIIFSPNVYSHTFYKDSISKSRKNLEAVVYSDNVLRELTTSDLEKLFNTIPPIDYVVLFYINLNSDCRNFMPLYSQLYRDLYAEGYKLKFVKFNCHGIDKRLKMCQKYNINVVPTLVYVSSYNIQRNDIPPTSLVRRLLRYLFFDKNSDINLSNATKYKGEIFAYDQLHDWVSLMYNLSSMNRRFGSKKDCMSFMKALWNEFTSIFRR